MSVSLTSVLSMSPERAWEMAEKSSTLLFVCRGVLGFRPESGRLPVHWQQGQTLRMRILLFGVVPTWTHEITIVEVSADKRQIFTHESGGAINQWNHLIRIARASNPDQSMYTDIVDIEAGLLTPAIWLYAHLFFRYRQWRWRKLAQITPPF